MRLEPYQRRTCPFPDPGSESEHTRSQAQRTPAVTWEAIPPQEPKSQTLFRLHLNPGGNEDEPSALPHQQRKDEQMTG